MNSMGNGIDRPASRLQWHPDWIRVELAGEHGAFIHPSGRILRVQDESNLDMLSQAMNHGRSLADVIDGMREQEAASFLKLARMLIEKGVLMRVLPVSVPWLSENKYARMHSQIISLAGMLRSTERALLAQKRLATAKAALIGVGGSGAMLALELVSAGVGEVRLVDDDRVEMGNLGRQFLYRECHVGIPKVTALSEILHEYDSEARVELVATRVADLDSAYEAVRGCDIAILTADDPWPELMRWVGAAARRAGCSLLPTFYSSYGPLIQPSAGPCVDCVLAWIDSGVREILGSSSAPLSASDGARRLGGMGIGIAAAASEYAREVVGYISGAFPVWSLKGSVKTTGGQRSVNTDIMSFRCDACSDSSNEV